MMMHWTALATIAALFAYFYVGFRVGKARARFKIAAPAITGNLAFERVFRAHQNMLEWLPIFLSALWLFAFYVSDGWAAAIGLVWIGARLYYAHAYADEASKRAVGFYIQTFACLALIIGATIGVLRTFAS